jgi:hypothetical protein
VREELEKLQTYLTDKEDLSPEQRKPNPQIKKNEERKIKEKSSRSNSSRAKNIVA